MRAIFEATGFRRVPLAWRMISRQQGRFVITVVGIGFTVLLMLLLFGTYDGIQNEANGYVTQRPADVWISQGNAKNLIRSSSFVNEGLLVSLGETAEIAEAAPLLRIIDTIETSRGEATLFILGIDPDSALTKPLVVAGTNVLANDEIILDRAFARKHRVSVADSIHIRGKAFRVAGLSSGTNAVITQFSFVALEDAQELMGFPGLISFALAKARSDLSPEVLAALLQDEYSEMSVFTQEQFQRNNLQEMRTGLLPILLSVAAIGGFVGIAVLSLLVYGGMIESRQDYALLKALGGGQGYLVMLLVRQTLVATAIGFLVGLCAFYLSRPLIVRLVPETTVSLDVATILTLALAVPVAGLGSAVLPVFKLGKIYPGEVFRA